MGGGLGRGDGDSWADSGPLGRESADPGESWKETVGLEMRKESGNG